MRFLQRLFRPRPAADCKPLAVFDPAHWQTGDLAECVTGRDWFRRGLGPPIAGPDLGERYIVRRITTARHPLDGNPGLLLGFAEWPDRVFDADCFRKVQPRRDQAVAATAEFVANLHRHTRRKESA